jgi:hypothetical protein
MRNGLPSLALAWFFYGQRGLGVRQYLKTLLHLL